MTDSATRPPRPDQARRAALLRHESTTRPPRTCAIQARCPLPFDHKGPHEWGGPPWDEAAAPDAGLREALEAMADRYAADWGEGAESSEEYRNARATLAAHPAPAPDRGRQLVEDVRADRIRGSWDEPPFGAAPAGPAVDVDPPGDAE